MCAPVVREEAAKGAIVVVVTHDESFAAAVADSRLALARGRVAGAEASDPERL